MVSRGLVRRLALLLPLLGPACSLAPVPAGIRCDPGGGCLDDWVCIQGGCYPPGQGPPTGGASSTGGAPSTATTGGTTAAGTTGRATAGGSTAGASSIGTTGAVGSNTGASTGGASSGGGTTGAGSTGETLGTSSAGGTTAAGSTGGTSTGSSGGTTGGASSSAGTSGAGATGGTTGALPTVAVTSPSNGATVLDLDPPYLDLTASATPTAGNSITQVAFFINGTILTSRTVAPYDVQGVSFDPPGTYLITAQATDSSGAVGTSAAVSLTVEPMPATYLFGDQALGSIVDDPGDYIGQSQADQYAALFSGVASTLYLYFDSTTTSDPAVAAIYSDMGGAPNAELSEVSVAPIPGNWNVIPLPAFGVTAGNQYWVALLDPIDGNDGGFFYRRDGSSFCNDANSDQTQMLSSLPLQWPPGPPDQQICMSVFVGGSGESPLPQFVQAEDATPQNPQQSVTATFDSPQSAGDANVVVVAWEDSTSVLGANAVTDSSNNVYTLVAGPTVSADYTQAVYFAPGIAAAAVNSITVALPNAVPYFDLRIIEYQGIHAVDQVAVAVGTAETASTASLTTTAGPEVILASGYTANDFTEPGFDFITRDITADGSLVEDEIVGTRGTYAVSAQQAQPGEWVMQAVSFK